MLLKQNVCQSLTEIDVEILGKRSQDHKEQRCRNFIHFDVRSKTNIQ